MSELDGTRTISIPSLAFNYVDNRLESIGTCGELYYRERGAYAPYAGTRWHELFGTPERAARTSWYMLMCKHVGCDECPISEGCDIATDIDCDDGEVALLEWLRGDA